jgi:hypothetical protein
MGIAHIESFNVRLRAECPNAHVFEPRDDAQEILHCGGATTM